MADLGCGPLDRIDGPLPLAPLYGLLQTAVAATAGVRVIPDADGGGVERWLNGAEVYIYSPETGEVWDANSTGTSRDKGFGIEDGVTFPQFAPMTAVFAETCKTYKVWSQAEYKARATTVFSAVESSIIAGEFMRGSVLTENPHLSDGNGDFPNGDVATSFPDAIAYLEEAIGRTGRQGLIHMSPQLLSAAAARYGWNYWRDDRSQVIRMVSGTVIVPDAGYSAGSTPTGHADPAQGQEWIYATGPIDIRRTESFIVPERVEQAVDRGTGGATTGRPNTVTYRVERYYLVDWDTQLQAAVLVDRCQDACA